jgi:hypothetical protein
MSSGTLPSEVRLDVNHLQAVIQIFAKDFFLDADFQILVTRTSSELSTISACQQQ